MEKEKVGLAIFGLVIIILSTIAFSLYIHFQLNLADTKHIVQECNKTLSNLSQTIDIQQEIIANLSIMNQELLSELEDIKLLYSIERQSRLDIENKFGQIEQDYNLLKTEKNLIYPTYKQLKDFVKKDKTERLVYSDDFDCTDFSYTFLKNFAKEGYYGCTAVLDLIEDNEIGGHMIVAVNTVDRGLIYIEPQDDYFIFSRDLQVGTNYCDTLDWYCQWEIIKVSSCFELKI